MANGVYVAASGSVTRLQQLETLSNNLAHAREAGFRRDEVTFREVQAERQWKPESTQDKDFNQTIATHVRLEPGPMDRTGNALDVALSDRGYLKVETQRGTRLTRNGRLMRGVDGLLRTQTGHAVLDVEDRRIALPPDRVPTIEADGRIHTEGLELGSLGVVSLHSDQRLLKDPEGLLVPPLEATADPRGVEVLQGHLEQANVSPVRAMTQLIEVQRHFAALQQVISAYQEIDRAAIRLPG